MRIFSRLAVGQVATLTLLAGSPAVAATLNTLYNFGDTNAYPNGLVLSKSGMLYGSTFYSTNGLNGFGTLFQFNPTTGTFATLYRFTGAGDGGNPNSSLALDKAGSLYGTTSQGGAYGRGTLFKFDVKKELLTTLYSFTGNADGSWPNGITLNSAGAIYGTTVEGGAGYGTLFSFSPSTMALSTLHSFSGGSDGWNPFDAVTLDKVGNLYGTTSAGGNPNGCDGSCGIIFKFDLNLGFSVLYSFTGAKDGGNPVSPVILDKKGNVYGNTNQYGSGGAGTTFMYSPGTGKLKVLHAFTGLSDGGEPKGALIFDKAGSLYGTTSGGGTGCPFAGCGTVFKIDPKTRSLTTLYEFSGSDGSDPTSGVIEDASGAFYGTTLTGGGGVGTVFELMQ